MDPFLQHLTLYYNCLGNIGSRKQLKN